MGIITNVMSIFFIAEFMLIGGTSLIMANITKKLLPSKYDGKRYYSNANMKPQWIVIHNVGPGSASACYNTFNDPGGRNVSTHFTCDDKEIIQMLEVSWKGIHTNGNAMSKGGCSEWASGKAPAVPCGANNSNSIGIEVGNNGGGVTSVNEAKALEVAIELTRYLMKELNIDADHVVRHGDTQPKNCPSSIMKNGGENWVYFKEQIKTRNEQNKPVDLNTSNISVQPGNNMGSPSTDTGGVIASPVSTGGGYTTTLLDTPLYASPTDIEVQLPDVDHRENTTNMDEVKGLALMFYPPYASCHLGNMEDHFKSMGYDRNFHYMIGPTSDKADKFEVKAGVDELKQSQGFYDNDTHTYIDRAIFSNKKQKHCLTVSFLCPTNVEDYPKCEKALIEGVAQLLHEHALEVKDLWREFDLNRAPSPFLYLERDYWKDFLTEVEKQLEWRKATKGAYTKTFTKYTAGSSGLSGGSTGSIASGGISGGSPGVSAPGGSSPGTGLNPGDTEMKSENQVVNTAYATFIGLGLTPEAACGIIGNMQQESGLKPTAVNPNGGATGLCQWKDGRLTNLKSYASSLGKDWTDVETQCKWAWEEALGKDPTTKSLLNKNCGGPEGFKALTDLKKAVDLWRKCFERCGENEAMDTKRLKYAQNWYDKVAKKENTGGGGTGTLPPLEEVDLEVVAFTNRPQPRAGEVFGWPIPGISKVSSKFGPRKPPCKGASSQHGGIDIGASSGTPILSYASGKVVQNVAWNKSAGNYIKIDHGNGVASRYLHMVQPSPLKVGDTVAAGQEVGKVGNTGVGTGPHLHFEIHINGTKVDPLNYVNPGGGVAGTVPDLDGTGGNSPVVGTPGTSAPGGVVTTPTVGGGGGGGTVGSPSNDLLYDDKQQDKTDAPIEGNSAGGQNHDDWGGKMEYTQGSPTDSGAKQPEIMTILTQEMYKELILYVEEGIVDDFVQSQDYEPYSKGLASVDDNQISTNDRISAMTKQFTTTNENTFHYKVIESGPGSKDHCVTIAEELNYLAVPQDLKVEPIYPDLVIPPGYISTEVDEASPNSIPVAVIQEGGITSSDSFTKQLSFDYDLLEEKKKVSNKRHHPINYTDPYPYDEKITDLEKHYPKVFIDEIEGQLYSCNHPGCPISQPMAKNFAMLSDAMMNQSKRMEQRLVKLENILSTIIRNQGRLGARMNINCVYYGGHSTFNKYKCIRCLHDDRIHDGQLVTVDQCLNCTRFEPILGQVYRILDDSGLNGSIILDDMQMSYTDLEGFRNLNDITHRSSKYFNAMATEEKNCMRPVSTLEEIYKGADKQQAIELIKKENTDKAEAQKKIDALKEEDYIFKMNWAETFFNSQEPDIKAYPNEGIVARQKADLEGDGPHTLEDEIAELDPKMDADMIEELKEQIRIRDNIWVDTREKADSTQMNKYSSENFFFEDFNKVRIGKYGIKFSSLYNYNGEDYNNIYSGTTGGSPGSGIIQIGTQPVSSSPFASQARDKIVEMAKQILQDCNDGKAWYSQPYRTVDYNKPVKMPDGRTGYDCSSLASCCYLNAGLKSMYSKTCSGGTLMDEIVNNGGQMWLCNDEGISKASPGDLIVSGSGSMDASKMPYKASISHVMVYIGDGKVIHARGKSYGIQQTELSSYYKSGKHAFVRPKDLMDTDASAGGSNTESSPTTESESTTESLPTQTVSMFGLRTASVAPEQTTRKIEAEPLGNIDGKSYVARVPKAVVTCYNESGIGASGMGCELNNTVASHNIPYGTKVYIPDLAGKVGNGIYTVTDTGSPLFDFSVCTTTQLGKTNMDVYVLEWGSGENASSYIHSINYYLDNGLWDKYKAAWNAYKEMGGKLVNFIQFNKEDANIKNHMN